MKQKKKRALILATLISVVFLFSLKVTFSGSYSVPLAWILGPEGTPIDANGVNVEDEAPPQPSANYINETNSQIVNTSHVPLVEESEEISFSDISSGTNITLNKENYSVLSYREGKFNITNVPDYNSSDGDEFYLNYTYREPEGTLDRSEIISNTGSGLSVSDGKLRIEEGPGLIIKNTSVSLDPEYLETLDLVTKSRKEEEVHTGIETVEPEQGKRLKALFSNNDTYNESEMDDYNLIKYIDYRPIYNDSIEVRETNSSTVLERSSPPCEDCYTFNSCNGKVNITDLDTVEGDNEDVVIEYKYPPQSTTGNETEGIIYTDLPILKENLKIRDSEGNSLEKGKCKDYEVLNYQAGKIKFWRYNITKGPENVSIDYNWSDFSNEIYLEDSEILVNETILSKNVKDYYVNLSGDNMTGDLNLSGNAVLNVSEITTPNSTLRIGGNTNLTSNYLLNTPSIKGVPTQGLVGYWPFENVTNITKDWSPLLNDGELGNNSLFTQPNITEGMVAKGLEFDGEDDYISIQGHVTESNTTTLSAWVKAQNTTGNRTIISIGDCIELRGVQNGTEGKAQFCNETGAMKSTSFNVSIDDGEWHHLTYVMDNRNGNQTVYVDGKKSNSSGYGGKVDLSTGAYNLEITLNTFIGASWFEDWPLTDNWNVSSEKEWEKAQAKDKDAEVVDGTLEIEKLWWVVDSTKARVFAYDSNWSYTGIYEDLSGQDMNPTGITRDNESNWWMVGDQTDAVYKYDSDWDFTEGFPTDIDDNLESMFQEDDGDWMVLGSENDRVYRYRPDWSFKNSVYIGNQSKNATGIWQGREDNIWRMITKANKTHPSMGYVYETLGVSVDYIIDITFDNETTGLFQDEEGNWWILGAENDRVYGPRKAYNLSGEITHPTGLYREVEDEGNWTSEWHDWEKWVLPQELKTQIGSTGGSLKIRIQSARYYNKTNESYQGINDTGWQKITNTDEVSINVSRDLGQARYTRVMFNMTRGPPSPEVLNYDLEVKTRGRDDFWNGSIDEVRIYNRALNQNEVRTLYEKGRNRRQEIGGAWLPREGGKLYGDLDMNDNKITGFFASKCESQMAMIQVHANGSYGCRNVTKIVLDLNEWVKESGDSMIGDLEMNNYNITNIKNLIVGPHQPLASPSGRLQVNYLGDASENTGFTHHPFTIEGDSQDLYIGYDPTQMTGYIQSYNSSLSLNNLGGNVGIGTTSPKRKLHIAGDVLLDNNRFLSWKKSPKALSFDGEDDYMEVEDSESLDLQPPFSISFWINQSKDSHMDLFAKEESYGAHFSQDNLYFDYWNETGNKTSLIKKNLENYTWHHVTIVVNSSFYVKGYVGGTKTNEAYLEEPNVVNNRSFRLGNTTWDDRDNFNGSIDEFRIYNRGLSQEEVISLSNHTHISDGLVAYWAFEDQNPPVVDLSGNGNYGYVHNANWISGMVDLPVHDVLTFDIGNDLKIKGISNIRLQGEQIRVFNSSWRESMIVNPKSNIKVFNSEITNIRSLDFGKYVGGIGLDNDEIKIGEGTQSNGGVALGKQARAKALGSRSIAIGYRATSDDEQSIALGVDSEAGGGGFESVAIGSGAVSTNGGIKVSGSLYVHGTLFAGNDINRQDEVRTNGTKAVLYRYFDDFSTDSSGTNITDTNIPSEEYDCLVGGWNTSHMNWAPDCCYDNQIYTYVNDEGDWAISANFASDSLAETWNVTVVCFPKEWTSTEGNFGDKL